MGALIARLRGRPRLQPNRLKAVWNRCLIDNAEYFRKVPRGFFSVIANVCRRDAGIAAILREQKYAETEAELQYVLNLLAVRIYEFFATIVDGETIGNPVELRRICFNLGKQHAAFTIEPFKVMYWDQFTLAMMEELELFGCLDVQDLRSWQALVHFVVEAMLKGYDEARSAQRGK